MLDVQPRKKGTPTAPSRATPRRACRPHLQVEALETREVPAALFATSYFDSAVYQFDSNTGALQATLVAPNSSTVLSGPAGMTLGPDGNLYLSSQLNNAILEYNRTTNALTTFIPATVLQPIAAGTGNAEFAPASLRFGPDGDLYVSLNGGQASAGNGSVIRFDVAAGAGGLAYQGTFATVASGLIQPTGLTFGTAVGDTNSLYVSSLSSIPLRGSTTAVGMVSKVANAPTAPSTTTFIQPGSGGLNYASGLTWGADGKLYVVDLGATSNVGNVLRYNADGSFETVFTRTNATGQGSLAFQFPADALFDDQGRLVTANLGPTYPPNAQGSIYQYGPNGVFLRALVTSAQFPNTGPGMSGISASQLAIDLGSTPITPPGSLRQTTIGAFDPSTATWYLRYSNGPGAPDVTPFRYGGPGWIPVAGDWDGNGTVTIGVVDPSTMTWYLKNTNAPGAPDITPFRYGGPGWQAVVGDWDGNGTTTIGVVDPTTMTWYLKNTNAPGAPDITPFRYGAAGWQAVVGDWDGNGKTTIGVVDPATETWYLKNTNAPGAPDITPFRYGAAGWQAVVGDWDGDGRTTIGVVDPSTMTWYLRNTNAAGAPDVAPFAYGGANWRGVPGIWNPDPLA